MAEKFILPRRTHDYDDEETAGRIPVSKTIAKAEEERAARQTREHRDGCMARPGKGLSNEEIFDRELKAYAYHMQHQPQFGRPEQPEGSDSAGHRSTLRVTDENCFADGSRTCSEAEFYLAQLYQSRYNPPDPLRVDTLVGREIDSRRDIRDSRCNRT